MIASRHLILAFATDVVLQTYDVLTIREQGQEPIAATPAQLTKLRADLDVVNQNIKVFRETLTDVVPRKETADELQLLSDLNDSCRQMQQRVLDLIRYVSNEEVTCKGTEG